jgi:basic membrane protein A and related proteins
MTVFAGRLALAVGLMATALLLVACGSGGDGSNASSTTAGARSSTKGKSLAWISENTRNDKSFGQASYNGAVRAAKKLGMKLTAVDGLMNKPQDAENAIVNAIRDHDFIVDGATTTYKVLPRLAQQNPGKQFGVDSIEIKGTRANLHYAVQDWYPLGYQAGVIGAKSTKTNVLGFIGGGEIPPTIAGRQGYEDGAKSVDPKIKVISTITGDFNDASKGSNAAQAQMAQHADVLFSFLDAGHQGVVNAAKSAGKVKIIGVLAPKCGISSGLDIGDAVTHEDGLVYNLILNMVSKGSKNLVYGIQDASVAGFRFCPGHRTAALQQQLDDVRQKFTSGELKTPSPGS